VKLSEAYCRTSDEHDLNAPLFHMNLAHVHDPKQLVRLLLVQGHHD
jgi:hypothetical protein